MLSTTNRNSLNSGRDSERGQALVVFALILVGLMLAGALALDVGFIMLERRDQQNAADAAALAGARLLPNSSAARSAASSVATANGFTNGVDSATVSIGATSTRVLVRIGRNLPSFFASVAGRTDWDVGALAVAISLQDQPPFAALTALNEHACEALKITGTGVISSWGDVQVNSDCPTNALAISGQGNLDLQHDGLACWVVGGYQISGKAQGEYCDPPQPGVPLPFPISSMPSNEATPTAPLQIAGTTKAIPDGCPGTTGYSDTTPKTCQFQSSYRGTTWRLYPGYYPGGIKLQGGTFYMEPGIYHLAGGGFTVTSTGTTAVSVEAGGVPPSGSPPPPTGGILLFNTTHSNFGSGPINIGGNGGVFNFHPLGGLDESCAGESEGWNRYLIFQDPAVTLTVDINGGSNIMNARGLVVAPTAQVKLNGGTGTLNIDAIVSDTYQINGNGGNLNVLYDDCALPTYTGYGLVI